METTTCLAASAAALATLLGLLLLHRQKRDLQTLRLQLQQDLAGQRGEAEMTRALLAAGEQRMTGAFQGGLRASGEQAETIRREVTERLGDLRTVLARGAGELNTALAEGQGRLRQALAEAQERAAAGTAGQFETTRTVLDQKLREMREASEAKLAEIQRSVNEQLQQAVEKQMEASFARVIDQFAAVQKAMGDVQAVTAQIGDIKRLFSNVRTRGGWGEAQVRAMLDDVLPPGSYECNRKLREDSDDAVEFVVLMPMRGERVLLPIDAKFPVQDYERLLAAAEAGDAEAERAARRGLEREIRLQARRIAEKYINPPVTVEFAVMYLPTDGLYAEVARIPGMIDEIGRAHRVLILGPSLFPALLRTIHLGHVTLTLEQKADEIRELLGATRTEMLKMDQVLEKLGKQAGTFSRTIDSARQRTRVVRRRLRDVEALETERAEQVLEIEAATDEEEVEEVDWATPAV